MIINLKNVDVNSIRALLDRSLVVTNTLDFEISSKFIKSSVSNEDQNFWKEWCIPTKGLFESEEFESIKVLFSNGVYFKNKFLGLFSGQKCDINITFNQKREAEMFEVIGKTSFNSAIKVNLRTTRYEMAKDPLEKEMHDKLFDQKNAITTFDIEPNIISEINKLRGLNSMADKPTSYVTFEGDNGILKAYDSSFEFEIGEYQGATFKAQFPKKSLALIDHEPHTIAYCTTDETEYSWFILSGKNAIVQSNSIAMLMTSLSSDASGIDDSFFSDDSQSWGME